MKMSKKVNISVVQSLCEREMGRNLLKYSLGNKDFSRAGNICEQLSEDKATIPTGNQACEFSGQTRATFLMTFSPDGTKMASTHGDHNVRITDLASGKCLHTLKGHPRTPWCVAFHPVSNEILASGCLGGEIRIWDLRGGGSEVWRSERGTGITSMAFHPTDQVLVFSVANEIHFWDWTEPEPFATTKTRHEYEKVRWVRFDPHGYYLYTGIGNGVSVHAADTQHSQEPSRSNSSSSQHVSETHANLQHQYRRILEEINQLRRDRLQSELSGGTATTTATSRPYPATSAAHALLSGNASISATSTPTVSTEGRPTSPSHLDALANARMYASAVTHGQTIRHQPSSLSEAAVNQVPAISLHSAISQSSSMTPRHITVFTGSPPSYPDTATTSTATSSEDQDISTSENDSTTMPVLSGNSVNPGRRQSNTRLSSFIRNQLTSSQFITSGPSRLSRDGPTSTQSSGSMSASNTVQPVSVVRLLPSATVTSSVAASSSASASSSTMSHRLASAFQLLDQSSTSRTQTLSSSSQATTTTNSSSSSVSGRFMSFLSRRAAAAGHFQCESGQCQICQNYSPPDLSRWSQPSQSSASSVVPIVPRIVSRSTNGREGPSTTNRRGTSGSKRLDGLLESEIQQALDQVRARRLDISETLRDLGSLRQELDMHNCPAPSSSTARDTDDPQPSTSANTAASGSNSEGMGLDINPSDSESARDETVDSQEDSVLTSNSQEDNANMDIPDPIQLLSETEPLEAESRNKSEPSETVLSEPTETESGIASEASNDGAMDIDFMSQESASSSSSLASSLDSLPSSQESQASDDSSDPTLAAIGNYSLEIERRVHDLDRRISDIQGRLQERLTRLRQQRESKRLSSSVPHCVSVSERIRLRHERLRTRLQDLRRKYQNRVRNNNNNSGGSGGHHERRLHSQRHRERLNRNSNVRQEIERRNAEDTSTEETPSEVVESPTAQSAETENSSAVEPPSTNLASSLRRHHMNTMNTIANIRAGINRARTRQRERERFVHLLQRRHLHPHYSVSILDDTINRPDDGFQAAINRAIAGAFIAAGENNVASNIVNSSFRIQRWEFSRGNIPEIQNSEENIIVPHCKLHNDSFCDVSQDGRYLAVFVPSHRGFPDDSILAVFSLAPENFKQCLYTKSFGPNFVSVSISPLNNYLLVGLATRRLTWVYTPRQMIAQVYKMVLPEGGEESTEHVCDLMHPCDMDGRTPVSLNSARWLPCVGEGIVYGTNRGDLHICRPGFEPEERRNTDPAPEPQQMRPSWFMNMLGMNVPRTTNTSTQTTLGARRTASTQTDSVESKDSA